MQTAIPTQNSSKNSIPDMDSENEYELVKEYDSSGQTVKNSASVSQCEIQSDNDCESVCEMDRVICDSPESYSDVSFPTFQSGAFNQHFNTPESNDLDDNESDVGFQDQDQDTDVYAIIMGIDPMHHPYDIQNTDDEPTIMQNINEPYQYQTIIRKVKDNYNYLKLELMNNDWICRILVMSLYAGVLAFTLIVLTDETNKALQSKKPISKPTYPVIPECKVECKNCVVPTKPKVDKETHFVFIQKIQKEIAPIVQYFTYTFPRKQVIPVTDCGRVQYYYCHLKKTIDKTIESVGYHAGVAGTGIQNLIKSTVKDIETSWYKRKGMAMRNWKSFKNEMTRVEGKGRKKVDAIKRWLQCKTCH